MEENLKIPAHVALILDGNGRWAKSKGMPRNYGHTMGAKNVEVICKAAHDMGISYLTLYAFSTENWNRPAEEVGGLMRLFKEYLEEALRDFDAMRCREGGISPVSIRRCKSRSRSWKRHQSRTTV